MKTIELFAGAGGLGMGIARAGFSPLAVVEWDKYCCDTIRENQLNKSSEIKRWPLLQGDVRDFSFKEFETKADLVSGGPPCQPFSLGGKHRGRSDQRDMFPQAVRVIREVKPKAFILENVKGLTRATFTSYFEYIKLQLSYPSCLRKKGEEWWRHLSRLERHHTSGLYRGLTYNVVSRVLNAADYGIPQKRERVFIVGFRDDLNIEWNFPEGTHSSKRLSWEKYHGDYWDQHRVPRKDRLMTKQEITSVERLDNEPKTLRWKTVRDAIQGLPDPEKHPRKAKAYLNHNFQPGAKSYPGHTGSLLDSPAKTLKAGVHGVPGGENMLRRPDNTIRYFSVRESARLQCFPDDFIFHGSWSETMRQLGNAVPVTLAETMARSVKSHL